MKTKEEKDQEREARRVELKEHRYEVRDKNDDRFIKKLEKKRIAANR